MYCAVRENALLFAIGEQALDRAIGEADLLRAVREVLLYLVVLEFEHLEAIGERGLGGLGLREEVDDLAARERLLDILILEENNLVAVGPDFALYAVREDDLLLPALVELLLLALLADDFVDLNEVLVGFVRVVLLREN